MIENSYINYVAGNNSFTLISLAHSLKIGFPEGASPKTRTGEEGSKRSNYLKIAAKQYYPHSYRWREKNIATRFYFRNTYLLKNFGGTYEKLVTVIYGRTLDGLPVKGASRIAVRMGINGELVGLVRNWPELNKKTVSSKDMIASRSRIDHLKRHLGSL